MEKKLKTSINFTRLPIFAGGKVEEDSRTKEISYIDNNKTIYVKIENGMLSNYERKVFLALEYLYLQQNPDFQKDYVRVKLKNIQDILGTKGKTNESILKSIKNLQKVNITSTISIKRSENIEEEEGIQFNLLPKIKWNTKRTIEEMKKYKVRKYTGHIDVYLQDFHIQNLKSNYYRLINFSLIQKLSNKSVRLFDYINLNAYYLDGDTYKQKLKLNISYDNLCDYLIVKKRETLALKKQQFEGQLKELKDLGVIKSFSFDNDLFNDTRITLYLSPSINLWTKHTPRLEEPIKKLSPIEYKLTKYLPPPQIKYLSKYPDELIEEKIEQLEYLLKNFNHKIKGTGSFLYNSIKGNWIDDNYKEYKEKLKYNEEHKRRTKRVIEEEELKENYEKYVNETCLKYLENLSKKKIKELSNKVDKILTNKRFIEENPKIKEFYKEFEMIKLVKEEVDLLDFVDWKQQYIF